MDLENVAFLPESNHQQSSPATSSSQPASSESLISPARSNNRVTNHNSSSAPNHTPTFVGSQPLTSSGDTLRKHFETDTSNLSFSGSLSSASQTMPGQAWSNQTSTSTSIESPRQVGNSNRAGLTGSGQSQHPNQYHSNPNAHPHTFPHPSFPLPSRAAFSTSRWRTFLASCVSSDSDRPIACADRVIYRPTANDEDQVTAAIAGSRAGAGSICPCFKPSPCTARSSRRCMGKTVKLLFLVLVVATVLETIHYFHNPCKDSNGDPPRSWLSKVVHPLGSLFGTTTNSTTDQLPYHSSSSFSLHSNDTEDHMSYFDTTGRPYSWHDIRLPSFIKPISYELFMAPSMVTFFNRGNVSIELELTANKSSTNFVVIHSKKLNITKVSLTRVELRHGQKLYSPVEVTRTQECVRLEQIYIELAQNMTTGFRYWLDIEFERQLEDELEGFYISSYYHSEQRRKRFLLTTHFEPTLARTAFPCFDEPAMKATFRLKMLHDPSYDVYFNTDIVNRKDVQLVNHTRRLSTSEPTVPMSTYLVAFVVCDFAVNTARSDEGIQIRTIVPADQNGHTRYALDVASKVLTFYKNFFKVAYPLDKLDMVAVPDFGAGAMENWGIITFRTTTLLYNEKESSSEMQEQVAIVIAHEIAHQWFGNLVTMNWWSELWLNEGFASYVENLGVDYIHPEWRMLDQFVISTTQQALAMDSLLSSHPIHTTVTNPAEIEAIFDMISYKKGSCLVRMIENFLGKENLQLGLEKYLNRYMYRTAKTSQLWESMSEVSSQLSVDVSEVMNTWIIQQGYPVISAKWSPDKRHIIVSQQRFVSSLSLEDFESQKKNNSALSQRWIVPLTVLDSQHNQSQLYWLNDSFMTIPVASGEANQWFKLNHHQSGFYRVNYDISIWRVIIGQLSQSNANRHLLSAADRAGLIDDALTLMRAGHLDVNTAMDLTRYLELSEHDYVPWETILNHFGVMDSLMLQHPQLHRYILRLIRSLVTKLGWVERPGDDMFEKKLRAIMLRSAVFYGDKEAIRKATTHFEQWMTDSKPIAANIREIIYNAGIQFGSDIEWNHCWHRYLNATDAAEKRLLLGALGSTRNHYLLSTYLSASLNKSLVRSQDTPFVIQNVARNPIGRTLTWNYVKANWGTIIATFGQGSFSLDAIISESTWHFFTEYEYNEAKTFFDSVQSVGSGKQAVRQSLEKIRANIYWKAQVESKVIRWLNSSQS